MGWMTTTPLARDRGIWPRVPGGKVGRGSPRQGVHRTGWQATDRGHATASSMFVVSYSRKRHRKKNEREMPICVQWCGGRVVKMRSVNLCTSSKADPALECVWQPATVCEVLNVTPWCMADGSDVRLGSRHPRHRHSETLPPCEEGQNTVRHVRT